MSNTAKILGLMGLLPFLSACLAPLLGWLSLSESARYFTQYSAVLLSFFGGIHWWDAVSNKRSNHQLYIAMLPTIVGWLCLVFSGDLRVLGVLSLSYLGLLIYDKFTLVLDKEDIIQYTGLRMILTTVVVMSHGWMIYLLTR